MATVKGSTVTGQLLTRDEIEREVRAVELYRGGESLAAVARAVGLSTYHIKLVVARARVPLRPASRARQLCEAMRRQGTICRRCGIKLASAPAGRRGVCGWCVKELGGGGT